MSLLPEHPDLEQARRQAKELLHAAKDGEPAALDRLAAVSAPLTLAPAPGGRARPPAGAAGFPLAPPRRGGPGGVGGVWRGAGAAIDSEGAGRRCGRPLGCAATGANSSRNNEPIIRLLLERGAPVRSE